MSRLRWSRRATRDLLELGTFIAADDPHAARRWIERLRERAARAALTPRAGRIVPELRRDDVREVFVRTYRIVYQIVPRAVVVLAVVEGHRQLPSPVGPAQVRTRGPQVARPPLIHPRTKRPSTSR